jgi:hypothetical protein
MVGGWKHSLHQKTLRPIVGAEGQDFAFAVVVTVSESVTATR